MSTKKQDIFAISGLAVLLGAGIPAVAMAEARVGVASAVNPDATSGGVGQTTRTITLGDAVIHNQVINTSGAGLVQVLLADGTTFTVGPNSSLTIDRFVYDPDAGTAKVSASLSKGFMRFIGGRTSKTEGGATINTPIGTAGIRGAVVDIDLGQIGQKPKRDGRDGKKDKQKDETPPHVSLIFGHEVTLSFNGVSNRLFQAGYSIVVDGGGRTVVRTPLPFLQAMQERLASHGGANGGVPSPPRDEQVANSTIPRNNSDTPLPSNVPVPQGRPVVPPEQTAGDVPRNAGVEQAADKAVDAATPTSVSASVRVLSSRSVADGGGNGILGGSTATDRKGTLTGVQGSDGTATLDDSSTMTLPVYADSAFTSHAISGYSYGGATYAGNAYVGTNGFRAYMLTSGTDPLYVISGTPTAGMTSVFSTAGTRHYTLTADALSALSIGGTTIPFTLASRFSGVDMSGAISSDLLVAATPSNSDSSILAKGLQSWIVIDGTGASQKSAIGIMTGSISLLSDGTSYGFSGERGGSDRLDASAGTVAYTGMVASAAGGSGGSSVFGANGDYMVLANDTDDASASFKDKSNYSMGPGASVDESFATAHVANLSSTDMAATQSYGGKTLSGYSSVTLSENGNPALKAGTVSMSFNATNGTFSAVFKQFDDDGNLYNDEIGFSDSYGGAVYLDDDNFAAAGTHNRSYVVNSKVAPVKIFDGGTSSELCNCDYMSWGWWGKADTGDGSIESAHMGNWVIGDVTANVDMPASGTATYSGHAVGSVVDGANQYIATGAMSATMDFSARTGNVAVSGFDGRSFGSNVSFAGSSTFSGTTAGTSITGSFVNGNGVAAQGVMGAFSTSDGSWAASGIFGGNRN